MQLKGPKTLITELYCKINIYAKQTPLSDQQSLHKVDTSIFDLYKVKWLHSIDNFYSF